MFLVYLILFLQINIEKCSANYSGKIVGGEEKEIYVHPYMVNIVKDFYNVINCLCSGTIITSQWILTSAHGVKVTSKEYVYTPFSLSIIAGSSTCYNMESSGQKIRIHKMIIHPNFTFNEYEELNINIALLKLETRLIFGPKIQPVKLITPFILNDSPIYENMNCEALGWGLHSMDDTSPPKLHSVELPLISQEKCRAAFIGEKFSVNLQNVYCTLDRENKGGCFGDSGGPLMCSSYQFGVLTVEMSCTHKYYPTIWARVDHYYQWITFNTEPTHLAKTKLRSNTDTVSVNIIFIFTILLNIF